MATAIREHHQRSGKRTQVLRDARAKPFVTWVEQGGFRADRERVDFTVWKHLRPIYAAVPQSIDGLTDWSLCLLASSQNGKSIALLLLSIWLGLRIELFRAGYYLPTDTKATDFSDNRWMGLVRDNPGIHALMGDPEDPHTHAVIDEGAMSIRKLWRSLLYFFSLGGKISTESNPMDAVFFDEVHAMGLASMERAQHRLDASTLKIMAFGSTGGFEGADIDFWFQRSDQRWFHTTCRCKEGIILAKQVDPQQGPLCIDRGNGTTPGVPRDYFYVCQKCKHIIRDPQVGQYVRHRTDADVKKRYGFQFPQMLSPRQTPAQTLEKWRRRISTQDYFNRVVGLPFTDPATVPINDTILDAAQNPDLVWGPPKRVDVDAVFLGLDQRSHEHHIVIKGKVGDRQRVLHLEVVQAADPWARVRELLQAFHVRYACLEALPNTDPAYALAHDFPGRVFVVDAYSDITSGMIRWGDRQKERVTDRRTTDDFKTPYTATVHRYKMMSAALQRWARGGVETPDARTLTQRLRTPEGTRDVMVCREMFWKHMKSVALVTELVGGEKKEDELKYRGVVKKIGPEDPHFAFANMLCDVAWARAYGQDFMLDVEPGSSVDLETPVTELPPPPAMDEVRRALPGFVMPLAAEDQAQLTCGGCASFNAAKNRCTARNLGVTATLAACGMFTPAAEEEIDWR